MMQEETARRVIDLGNNKIYMTRTDPYGMIYISFDKGGPPDWLKGAYTSYDMAKRDVDRYLLDKKKTHLAKEVTQEA